MLRRRFLKLAGGGLAALGAASIGASFPSEKVGSLETPPLPPFYRESITAPFVSAADYYVAPDGSDRNPGTMSRPLATLSAAADLLKPGDVLFLRDGTYEREGLIEIRDVKGTRDEPIVIQGRPGERPVFSFGGPMPGGWDHEGGLLFGNVDNVVVRNLVVGHSPHMGIRVVGTSENNVFENVGTFYNNLVGFGMYGHPKGNLLSHVVSAYNFDRQGDGTDADGIQISGTGRNTIRASKTYRNSDDGVDLWESTNVRIDGCLSWGNGRGRGGDGNGFKLGGGDRGKSGGQRVRRSVAFDNRRYGFNTNGATTPIELYNCTAWNNRTNYLCYDAEHVLRNNISDQGPVRLEDLVRESHNSWNLDISEPGFASRVPLSEQFLHLSSESLCINLGRKLSSIRHYGAAPDLGAYEYQPGDSGP